MSADVIAVTIYLPICHECGWEGRDTTVKAEAQGEGAHHDATNHQGGR